MSVMELVSEEQVLNAVKSNGPVIPMDIRQIIKAGDSITIGATLSTLSDRGLVLITHIKRGGSPFYYIKGQEEKLAELSKFLNEKDRKTFDTLKEKKIIKDSDGDPLTRISLRNMPDFAKSMAVEIGNEQEIFWKWYTLSEEEANSLINSESIKKEKRNEEKNEETKSLKHEEKNEEAKEEKKEQKELSEQKQESVSESSEIHKDKKTKKEEQEPKSEFLEVNEGVQQKLGDNHEIISRFNDSFISKIGAFLSESKIYVKEAKQLKKGVEYDLVLGIPTPVGSVEYFCKAKSKKKCNEGDLSSAYIQGQNMRLPVLFLTTGEVVKKAKEKLRNDFKGMIVKEL